jgi:hypothetical protein
MLGKLSIAGAVAAILMIPTALSAQVGGAVNRTPPPVSSTPTDNGRMVSKIEPLSQSDRANFRLPPFRRQAPEPG